MYYRGSLSYRKKKKSPILMLLQVTHLCLIFNEDQQGFPGGIVVENLPANAGDIRGTGSIPALGRSPGEGNGYPLHSSCLENPMDRGAWQATVHGVTKSRTRLSNWARIEISKECLSYWHTHTKLRILTIIFIFPIKSAHLSSYS